MSLYARIAALALVLLAIGAAWWKLETALTNADRRGYERARAEDKAAADAQAERNRELQRSAEKRYVVRAEVQEQFFPVTIREVHHAAAPLATCAVPESVRVRVNAAARCALGDSPAACGADDGVSRPR